MSSRCEEGIVISDFLLNHEAGALSMIADLPIKKQEGENILSLLVVLLI